MPQDFGGHLARCGCFTADLKKGGFDGYAGEESFVSLLVTDGSGTLHCGGETATLTRGDSVFLPAGSGAYTVEGNVTALVTRIPPE